MVDRKRSEEYKQICAHLPISLIRKFKGVAVSRDLKQAEAVEQAIELWVKLDGDIEKLSVDHAEDSREELASFLRSLSRGEKPGDVKCCLVAHEAGLSVEEVKELRDRLFKGAKNGNGNH